MVMITGAFFTVCVEIVHLMRVLKIYIGYNAQNKHGTEQAQHRMA